MHPNPCIQPPVHLLRVALGRHNIRQFPMNILQCALLVSHVAVVLSLVCLVYLSIHMLSESVRFAVLHAVRHADCGCAVCSLCCSVCDVRCAECSVRCAGCYELAAALTEGARLFQVWTRRVLLCPGPHGLHVESRRVLFGPVSHGHISGW